MLTSLMAFWDRKKPDHVVFFCLVLLATVAMLDHLSGTELSFSIFYLPPIVLASWYSKRWLSRAFCFLAAFVWLLVDYTSGHTYSHNFILIWNTAVRLSFFLITSYLLVELKNSMIAQRNMANTDGLTGILNARAFKERSGSLLELATRHRHPMVLGFIDVDNFKAVNDQLGHSEGDRVLKTIANTLMQCVRGTDAVGRIGGDEFAVLLPETDYAGAQRMFNRIHKELTQTLSRPGWPVGFSVGVAVFSSLPGSVDDALKIADGLMYRVKKTGKNNLVYEEQTQNTFPPHASPPLI